MYRDFCVLHTIKRSNLLNTLFNRHIWQFVVNNDYARNYIAGLKEFQRFAGVSKWYAAVCGENPLEYINKYLYVINVIINYDDSSSVLHLQLSSMWLVSLTHRFSI